jgi:HEAT repeat protein
MRQSERRGGAARESLGAALVLIAVLGLAGPAAAADRPDVADLVARGDVEALKALGPSILPEVLRLYAAGDEDKRANVASILYGLGWKSEEAMRLLMADVHTEHEGLRVSAQYALGRVSNSDQVVDVLFENMMRTDSKWLFRDKAACGLAYDQIHLTEQQKVRLFARMIEVLDDADAGTRQLAIQVLVVYTGQSKGYDPGSTGEARTASIEQWWKWLDEYRRQL